MKSVLLLQHSAVCDTERMMSGLMVCVKDSKTTMEVFFPAGEHRLFSVYIFCYEPLKILRRYKTMAASYSLTEQIHTLYAMVSDLEKNTSKAMKTETMFPVIAQSMSCVVP